VCLKPLCRADHAGARGVPGGGAPGAVVRGRVLQLLLRGHFRVRLGRPGRARSAAAGDHAGAGMLLCELSRMRESSPAAHLRPPAGGDAAPGAWCVVDDHLSACSVAACSVAACSVAACSVAACSVAACSVAARGAHWATPHVLQGYLKGADPLAHECVQPFQARALPPTRPWREVLRETDTCVFMAVARLPTGA